MAIERQIERIRYYEEILTHAENGRATDEQLRELEAYYTSAAWKEDYEADEAGLLPADLKRGVLSQDGIDNVLWLYSEANQEDALTED